VLIGRLAIIGATMVKDIVRLKEKYQALRKTAEYVDIGQVVNDLYYLIQTIQIKCSRKGDR
jgi:hypothetical protein